MRVHLSRGLMSLRFEAAGTVANKTASSRSIRYISTREVCTTTVPTQLLWHICKCGMTRPQSSDLYTLL